MGSRRLKPLRHCPPLFRGSKASRQKHRRRNESGAASSETDHRIAHDALNAIRWLTTVPDDEIQIAVTHGELTLTGNVQSPGQKSLVEQIVHRQPGVRKLRNELKVFEMVNTNASLSCHPPVLHSQTDFFTQLYDGSD